MTRRLLVSVEQRAVLLRAIDRWWRHSASQTEWRLDWSPKRRTAGSIGVRGTLFMCSLGVCFYGVWGIAAQWSNVQGLSANHLVLAIVYFLVSLLTMRELYQHIRPHYSRMILTNSEIYAKTRQGLENRTPWSSIVRVERSYTPLEIRAISRDGSRIAVSDPHLGCILYTMANKESARSIQFSEVRLREWQIRGALCSLRTLFLCIPFSVITWNALQHVGYPPTRAAFLSTAPLIFALVFAIVPASVRYENWWYTLLYRRLRSQIKKRHEGC